MTLPAGWQVPIDPELGIDYSRVVHGEQRFLHARPITAGDGCRWWSSIDDDPGRGRQRHAHTRAEVATVDGEHVLTAIRAWSCAGPAR